MSGDSITAGPGARSFSTPREDDLGLRRVESGSGLSVSLMPNGGLFAIEHRSAGGRILINQVLGSPLCGGIGRMLLRLGGAEPRIVEIAGAGARAGLGVGADRIVWTGEDAGIRHAVTLWLHPALPVWLWQVAVEADGDRPCDAVLVQDIGLGDRGFLMNNEAYGSQYTDHHVAHDPAAGPVVMSRQNLAQGGRHPWLMQGCLDGAAGFATDALQVFGPAFRDRAGLALPFGRALPGVRLQHEVACVALQSPPTVLAKGKPARWTFFACYDPDHAAASGDADLARLADVRAAAREVRPAAVAQRPQRRSLVQDAAPLAVRGLSPAEVETAWPDRRHEERRDGRLLSFFVPDGALNRHVVLRDKEHRVTRRHGTLLRSGRAVLPDEATLCATAWMHGVFAAQLTLGNTAIHKLFSVSRDPYNITRASGLRILAEIDGAWRLLTVPSAFDMGLSDCRWIYALADRTITVRAVASGEDAAMQWRVEVEGPACRFLVFGHLVLGERELDHAAPVAVDAARRRVTLRPDPASLWGRTYPDAAYHLVTATPQAIESVGGDELLHADGMARDQGYVALRSHPATAFDFAVVGSMTDGAAAARLAERYAAGIAPADMLAPAARHWAHLTRGLRLGGPGPRPAPLAAAETAFPWFVHNAMMHLSVPHGLEQYTGAAWGTRDVCQGPVELLLSLEHDAPVKDILRIVFAQQYEDRGDWPQWFMLEPYSAIQERHAHGDVILWPLKALCDYVEATDDLAFLDEPVAWRRESDLARTGRRDPVAAHVDKLLATVAQSFVPGTHLVRYGEGDWNDSLQPADPAMRERMVSSWTVALLFHQLNRYAAVLRRAGRSVRAGELEALAVAVAADFRRYLMRDGTVAGYAVFTPGSAAVELMLHPSDRVTGLSYSLLPMSRAILSGLFTPEETRHHLALIREHLLFPDGVRLVDRPVAYRGGLETIFRRAESSSFFGREIGLMYVHAHIWHAETMALLDQPDALWTALDVINPISVTERLAHASLRQRNCYFSSSDAAFPDRYAASRDWARVGRGDIPVDGGWRIYSSGPGLYVNTLIRHAFGVRRLFGERTAAPVLPPAFADARLEMAIGDEESPGS